MVQASLFPFVLPLHCLASSMPHYKGFSLRNNTSRTEVFVFLLDLEKLDNPQQLQSESKMFTDVYRPELFINLDSFGVSCLVLEISAVENSAFWD